MEASGGDAVKRRDPPVVELRSLVGSSRDVRTEFEKARYEKKLRLAKLRREQHRLNVRSQAI